MLFKYVFWLFVHHKQTALSCAIVFERMNPERQAAQQLREKHYFQILGANLSV